MNIIHNSPEIASNISLDLPLRAVKDFVRKNKELQKS